MMGKLGCIEMHFFLDSIQSSILNNFSVSTRIKFYENMKNAGKFTNLKKVLSKKVVSVVSINYKTRVLHFNGFSTFAVEWVLCTE